MTLHRRQWGGGRWIGAEKKAHISPVAETKTGTFYGVRWHANRGSWKLWWTFSGANGPKTAKKRITIKK